MARPQPGQRITIKMAKVMRAASIKINDYTSGERTFMILHTAMDVNKNIYTFLHKNKLAMEGEFINFVGTVKGYANNNIIRLQRVKILKITTGIIEHA